MQGDNCSRSNCNNIAIGYESGASWGMNVCKKHASRVLRELKPGEIKRVGQLQYFHKYKESK